eukprot:scaffold28173_cov75-Isochrysis_galbana.AAC.1
MPPFATPPQIRYLDATFCYAFQRWAASGIDVQLLVRALLLVAFCYAAIRAGRRSPDRPPLSVWPSALALD